MGQARLREAEIKALKSRGPKVKATVAGYRPDAGFNSPALTESHYWVSAGEFIQDIHHSMSRGISPRAYSMNGSKYIELNFSTDIMDVDGVEHMAPQTDKGYFATIRFTPTQLKELATEIRKGAMSFRITGVPDGEVQKSMGGESFMVIDYRSSWSAGNDAGLMHYSWITDKGMANSNSDRLAETLESFAVMLDLQD